MDADKRLDRVMVSFRRLATGESLTVKYRVDGATAWTTIGTFSTVGQISYTFMNIAATGIPLAGGREYEFRLESTGGLEITSFALRARILNNP